MIGGIGLCANKETLAHPESLGLEDVALEHMTWLQTFSQGSQVREAVANGEALDEIWIISAEDISVINLTAALRKDGFSGTICMVDEDANGSSLSRAHAAGASTVYTPEKFVARFSLEANRRKRMNEVAATFAKADINPPVVVHAQPPMSGNPRSRSSAYSKQLGRSAALKGNGKLIVVVGASGGVGKSTIVASIAMGSCTNKAKTLVVDADLQFGSMHRMFAVKNPITFDDAATDERALVTLAASCSAGEPAILAAPSRLEHSETLAGNVAALVSAATNLFDVVVVDTGSAWTDMHAQLMEMATSTVFVIDQRSESIRACQHALELCRRIGLPTGSFTFVLNKCSKEAAFSPADVSCALDGMHVYEFADGGAEVEELCGGGMALSLPTVGSVFSKSVSNLVSYVAPELVGKGISSEVKERNNSFFASFGQRRERQKRRRRKENEIVVQAGPPHPEFRSARHAWESL